MCGGTTTVASEVNVGTPKVTITMPTSGMTVNHKCTWVAWSTVSGPSFKFLETTAATPLGVFGTNWEIHAMEYTASTLSSFNDSNGSLVPGAGTGGLIKEDEALAPTSYVPLFTMPANQFATLRTWYGEGL